MFCQKNRQILSEQIVTVKGVLPVGNVSSLVSQKEDGVPFFDVSTKTRLKEAPRETSSSSEEPTTGNEHDIEK
jgi:hypothetical protein